MLGVEEDFEDATSFRLSVSEGGSNGGTLENCWGGEEDEEEEEEGRGGGRRGLGVVALLVSLLPSDCFDIDEEGGLSIVPLTSGLRGVFNVVVAVDVDDDGSNDGESI